MIFEKIGLWFPAKFRLEIERLISFAGISESPERWLGKLTTNSVAIGFAGVLALQLFWPVLNLEIDRYVADLAIFLLLFVFGSLLTALLLYYEVKARTKKVEQFLPDFLQLIVSNLDAGVSPFDSFRNAVRPEFGPLYKEVLYVSARTQGTGSISFVFRELSNRVQSKSLSRVVSIFEKGLRSGSKLSVLLKAVAEELRTSKEMEDALLSSVKSHVIFLMFLLVLIAPFLLSVSGQFIKTYKSLDIESSGEPNMLGISVGGNPYVSKLDLSGLFIGILLITSLLASGLIGLLLESDPVFGLRYFPIIGIVAVGVYLLSSSVLSSMLGAFG